MKIYMALVHSNLNYCTSIWGFSNDFDILQTSQNKALRTVFNEDPYSNRKLLYQRSNVLPVKAIYEKQRATYIYKTLKKQYNVSTAAINRFNHQHFTRGRRNLELPVNRLHMTEQRISVSGSTFYNGLPPDIKSSENVEIFKIEIKKHLLKSEFLNLIFV